jgi:hypothetical protein
MIGSYAAQDIWWKQATGNDGYGQPVLARAVECKGRWVEKRRIVRSKDGREVLSEISVTLAGDHEVAAGDQVSNNGETYFDVISVSRAPGLGGDPLTTRAFC